MRSCGYSSLVQDASRFIGDFGVERTGLLLGLVHLAYGFRVFRDPPDRQDMKLCLRSFGEFCGFVEGKFGSIRAIVSQQDLLKHFFPLPLLRIAPLVPFLWAQRKIER